MKRMGTVYPARANQKRAFAFKEVKTQGKNHYTGQRRGRSNTEVYVTQ